MLLLTVCRDLELRVNNKSINGHGGIVEVCIDDEWHEFEATSAKVANGSNSKSPQDISVMIMDSTSESVILEWSGQQSIPSNKNISGYDLSCTTSSLSDHRQIHEVRVPNISTSTTRIQVSGLLPGTAYQCCVNAHIQTNTPLDLINSNCVATSTKSVHIEPMIANGLIIGLGVGLGVCSLLLLVFILLGFKVSKTTPCTNCLRHDSTSQRDTRRYIIQYVIRFPMAVKPCSNIIFLSLFLYRATDSEEYNLVVNPIYDISISMQYTPQQGMITTSTAVPTGGDAAAVIYEEVSDVHDSTTITASQLATDVKSL